MVRIVQMSMEQTHCKIVIWFLLVDIQIIQNLKLNYMKIININIYQFNNIFLRILLNTLTYINFFYFCIRLFFKIINIL